MTTNYTPGPWKANRVLVNNEPDRAMIHQGAWGGDAIADLGTFERYNPYDGYLIAAAPELLSALKAITSDCAEVLAGREPLTLELIHAIANGKARAAIMKAEGDQ